MPLAVFALLLGLSMDYEVFILTRVNEEYEQAGDTREAVIRGIGHTGRLVTCGALILCLAFIALGGAPVTDVKILATGLAAGIVIDATIIRGVLAPPSSPCSATLTGGWPAGDKRQVSRNRTHRAESVLAMIITIMPLAHSVHKCPESQADAAPYAPVPDGAGVVSQPEIVAGLNPRLPWR